MLWDIEEWLTDACVNAEPEQEQRIDRETQRQRHTEIGSPAVLSAATLTNTAKSSARSSGSGEGPVVGAGTEGGRLEL